MKPPTLVRCGAGILLLLATVLLTPSRSSAQLSTTRGFSLGAHLQGTSLTVEDGESSSGGGLGLRAGYGFNRLITAFVHLDASEIDVSSDGEIGGQWSLTHAEVGARFHFANSLRRWVPYLEASAGSRNVSVTDAVVDGEALDKLSFNGGAFTVGTGLSLYFRKTLALDASLKWTGGTFNEVDLGSVAVRSLDVEATSFRFGLGLIWWP